MIKIVGFSRSQCFSSKLLKELCKYLPSKEQCMSYVQLYTNKMNLNVHIKLQMFKLVLEKAEEPEIKLPTSAGSSKKQESCRKTSISALLTMPKPLTVWITINCGKFFNPLNCFCNFVRNQSGIFVW